MSIDPNVALAVRRDLHAMAERHDALLAALAEVAAAPNAETAIERAFRAGLEFPGLPSIGELASRHGRERDDLLLAATDTDAAREQASALVAAARQGAVFRALRHVFKESFRSKTLDEADRTRVMTRTLLDQPVWPGSATTLRNLYVSPACTLEVSVASVDEGGDVDVEVDMVPYADPFDAFNATRRWVATRPRPLIVITGAPGIGKSALIAALADRLADDPDVLPLVVGRGLQLRIAKALLEDPETRLVDRELLPTIVWFDDGGIIDASPAQDVVVRASTQEDWSRWNHPDALIRVQPFDGGRIREWVRRWNLRASHPLEIEPLLRRAEAAPAGAEAFDPAAVPFTLLLLAQMAEKGRKIPAAVDPFDRAHLLREMISWACERASREGEVPVVRLRDELREAATRMRSDPRSPIGPPSLNNDEVVLHWLDARDDRLPFPLARTAEGSITFFREPFLDYLLGERIAFECSRLCADAPDVGGVHRSAGHVVDLARRWVSLFGRVTLDESLEALLRAMIPTWPRFVRGKSGTPKAFSASWRAMTSSIYRHLASESSWRTVVEVAGPDEDPSTIRARSLFALLRLGGLVDVRQREPFAPEAVAPGRFPSVLMLLRAAAVNLPSAAWESFVTLRDASLSQADLLGADLTGVDLTGASLVRADLRGADLRRAKLDRTNLRRARLDGALLDDASMANAVLIHTSHRGVSFSAAQRAAAAWTNDEARTRGLPAENAGTMYF